MSTLDALGMSDLLNTGHTVQVRLVDMQVSGTGHAGMEAAIANCIEPGETIVVANSGIWGQRVCDLSERYGGEQIQSTTVCY